MSNPIRNLLGLEARSALSPVDAWWRGLDGQMTNSSAGISVTALSAMQLSTVYACIRVLSEGVASFPMNSHVLSAEGVPSQYPRPAWMSFNTGPFTRMDVNGQLMTSLVTDGNGYVATMRDGDGNVASMRVLDPALVTPVFNPANPQEVMFKVRSAGGNVEVYGPDAIMHVRGMAMPGSLTGISPIQANKETIGLGLAAQTFGSGFFGNGGLPGSIVTVDGTVSDTTVAQMKRAWADVHQGAENSNKLAVFTEGATLQKVTVPPDDAQFLETRAFQVNDVARIYGVPTNLLQHSDGPEMGKSLSDKNTHFVQHTLRPFVNRIEDAFTRLMHSEGHPREAFVKLDLDALQRGDYETRHGVYNAAVTSGLYTINEVRGWEALPAVEWGDAPISVQVLAEEIDEDTDPAGEGDADPEDSEDPSSNLIPRSD